MQLATTTPVGTPTETILTIRIFADGDHLIAQWSAETIGDRPGFRADTIVEVVRNVLDSIWEEGMRPRRRGRPSRRSEEMGRLVRSQVRVVIEIESMQFDSLRTSKQETVVALATPRACHITGLDRVH